MKTSELLRKFSSLNMESRLIDVPFLLRAHEEGMVDETSLEPVSSLLAQEFADEWVPYPIADILDEIGMSSRPSTTGIVGKDRGTGSNLHKTYKLALSELGKLSTRFPEAADYYRPWLERIDKELELHRSKAEREKLEQSLNFFRKSVYRELERQDIYEKHFWNGVQAKLLDHYDSEENRWLTSAHYFLSMLGGANDLSHSSNVLELGALKLQIPILARAISHSVETQGVRFNILGLGERTLLEIRGRGSHLSLDTPEFASLGVAMGAQDARPADDRLTSIAVGPEQTGWLRWKKLIQSPLFIKHGARLLPSKAFWGVRFPEFKPSDPPAFLEEHLVGWSSEDQHLWAKVLSLGKSTLYEITIVNQMKGRGGYIPNAALSLVISDGKIKSANYTIFKLNGEGKMIVNVDKRRIENLVARASKKSAPIVSKEAKETTLKSEEVEKRFGGIVSSAKGSKPEESEKKDLPAVDTTEPASNSGAQATQPYLPVVATSTLPTTIKK
ncbi:MAG TPA: hypothetical protein PLZ86_01575 [bacterium]|nr:hypothetical protein [bacterium]